jgi:tRNA threonylcarbamoyladenosine biosynthesis protein TsaB
VESGRAVVARHHEQRNAHGEALFGLSDAVLAEAGWERSSLDRIAVGIGPGSFTGLRVGIAFAQGIGLGLDRPVVGVGSLAAMCRAVPSDRPGLRCAVMDARRDELFVAVHDANGEEIVAPRAIARSAAVEAVGTLTEGITRTGPTWVELTKDERLSWLVGELASELAGPWRHFRSEEADLPHATLTALVAQDHVQRDADPMYVRPVDAIRPKLPPSPLS